MLMSVQEISAETASQTSGKQHRTADEPHTADDIGGVDLVAEQELRELANVDACRHECVG